MASSFLDKPIMRDGCSGGSGLAGKFGLFRQMDVRIREAVRLGFNRCLVPKTNAAQLVKIAKMEIAKLVRGKNCWKIYFNPATWNPRLRWGGLY